MKRVICLLLVLACFLMTPATVFASDDYVVTLGSRFDNVPLSNGYRGFCLDRDDHTDTGEQFTPAANTSAATSNVDGADVSHYIKVMFTQCFADIFDSNYTITDTGSNTLQSAIYHFTDGSWPWGAMKTLTDTAKAYTGPAIPDHGYQLTMDNGDTVTFDFMVLLAKKDGIQDFFAYRLTVTPASSHEHKFGKNWETSNNKHWHECECGEKKDVADHVEEIRNAKEAKEFEEGYTGDTYCKDCDKLLKTGTEIPATHMHDLKWVFNSLKHWKECECGETSATEKHAYKNDICEICGAVNPNTSTDNPDTGDTSHTLFWSSLIVLSGIALGMFTFTPNIFKRKLR